MSHDRHRRTTSTAGRWTPGLRFTRLVALLWVGLVPVAASAQDSLAKAVKATFLYKFAPFVDWPAGALPAPDSPLQLCVAGDDPFGPVLDRAVAGVRVGARAIVLRRMGQAAAHSGCDIMFVAGSQAQPVSDALKAVRGEPVLTVTDDQNLGAVIDFVAEGGHIRFRIDNQAAADNGLTLSSKLLSIAVSVIPRTTAH